MRFVKDAKRQEEMWERQHEVAADKIYDMCADLGGFFLKVLPSLSNYLFMFIVFSIVSLLGSTAPEFQSMKFFLFFFFFLWALLSFRKFRILTILNHISFSRHNMFQILGFSKVLGICYTENEFLWRKRNAVSLLYKLFFFF